MHTEERARLRKMWRASKLAAMPTEEIEARLLLIGVPLVRAEFIEEVTAWRDNTLRKVQPEALPHHLRLVGKVQAEFIH